MTAFLIVLGIGLVGQAGVEGKDENSAGSELNALVSDGVKLGGIRVVLPRPLLPDGASEEDERSALRTIAGSDRGVVELTRDAVTAPVVTRTSDEADGTAGIVRKSDIYFVLRARLDEIDPSKVTGNDREGTVEAGNMRFTNARVDASALQARGITVGHTDGPSREWFVHSTSRLLDRIHVESTDRVNASKGEHSWLIVSRTDPRFDDDKTAPNLWTPIARKGERDKSGASEPYPGGVSYVKVTQLQSVHGALLVETHAAFYEPRAWFHGAPTLRSKIGVVAQDRVRTLRRDLARGAAGRRAAP